MPSSRDLTAVAVLVALALALGACGGGNTGAGTVPEPTASAPDATAPAPDATQPGTGSVTTPTTTAPAQTETQTEPATGGSSGGTTGGGGEEAVRVPAAFAVANGRLTPPTITVPPFLAVEISLTARDGKPHRLVVRTPTPHTLRVPAAGGRAAIRIPGLRAGHYAVLLDGRRAGALVAGGEVGP